MCYNTILCGFQCMSATCDAIVDWRQNTCPLLLIFIYILSYEIGKLSAMP
jgi:hypothetical protein